MTNLIKASKETMCFWLMTFVAIMVTITYVVRTQELKNELLVERDVHRATVEELIGKAKSYQDKLLAQQDEVAEIERKKAEQAKKDAIKKARLNFTQNEVTCLADNIYHEAAFEPEEGQLAVATVTMNRVADKDYPKTVCGVVYERHIKKDSDKIVCMFSWTCKPRTGIHPSLYQKVIRMARDVYFKHERNGDVADATLYHAAYIKAPNWADPENLVATIGQHLFYRQ
jgi:spore germination cell wall hydrolase CwlJ-like protein